MLSSTFFLPGSIPLLPEGPFYNADTSNYPCIRNVYVFSEPFLPFPFRIWGHETRFISIRSWYTHRTYHATRYTPLYGNADTQSTCRAVALLDACIDDYAPQCGGWQRVSGRHSLGVFIWGTLSVMDQMVGRAVNEPRRRAGPGLEVVHGTMLGLNTTGWDVA